MNTTKDNNISSTSSWLRIQNIFLACFLILIGFSFEGASGAFTSKLTRKRSGRKLVGPHFLVSEDATFDIRNIPPISDTTPCKVMDDGYFFPSEKELSALPKGDQGGYHIVRQLIVPGSLETGFVEGIPSGITSSEMTLHNALTVLDPENYPTLSRARKACRKGLILVGQRKSNVAEGAGSRIDNLDETHLKSTHASNSGNRRTISNNFRRGKVGDLVHPGDIVGCQMFLGNYKKKQCYPNIQYTRPQFKLPVMYEDDHIAIVNKPAGISVYAERRSRSGSLSRRTVHFALPFVLSPPAKGTSGGILRRPALVHRLDKPTSGLLLVAKTKLAMNSMYEQFRDRKVQKIYTAIVNGIPLNLENERLHLKQSNDGLAIANTAANDSKNEWKIIDYPLGGKYAITSYRVLRQAPSLNAKDGILSMVEVRPHTGRYHQIRRHMAWICRRPLVGDSLYAGAMQAHHFRRRGLWLCSNGVTLEHPIDGRAIEVTLNLPKRFEKLMNAEESWSMNNNHFSVD